MKQIPAFTRICLVTVVVCISIAISSTSCKTGGGTSEKKDSLVADSPFDTLINFCNWSELGLREAASEKSKYLTTIYLGEQFTPTGDTASSINQNARYHYHKIKLTDGKEGWARDEFIALQSVPAVLIKTTAVCARPDDASITDKTFAALEFVSARSATGGWVEVIGKPAGQAWFQKGYVKSDVLSFKNADTELAALYRRANETADPGTQKQRLDRLRDDRYKSSQLYALMFPAVQDNSGPAKEMSYNFDGDLRGDGNDAWTGHNISYVKGGSTPDDQAVSFDGTSSYVNKTIADDPVNISYCFWLRAHDVNTTASIMMVGNGCTSGYGLTTEDDGNGGMRLGVLCGGIQTNITNSEYSLPVNQWVHIALIKEGNTFTLFVNGKESSSGSSPHNSMDGNFSLGAGMGCNPAAFGGFFGCDINDLYISLSVLSADELSGVRDAGG